MIRLFEKIIVVIRSIIIVVAQKILHPFSLKMSLINSIRGKIKITLNGKADIKIGKYLMSKGPLYIEALKGGSIVIGDRVFFNHNCSLTCMKKVEIGDHSMFGNNVVIVDHNHIFDSKDYKTEEIIIGKKVWIGANTVIVPGAIIDDGAVIAANSVVNKHVGRNEIWGGCPAKFIKMRCE